ncbi:MAG: c-type cytochrome [Planctomycetes bacterium]|nr:c-type cytochrome [Planctomycetota bacterium]
MPLNLLTDALWLLLLATSPQERGAIRAVAEAPGVPPGFVAELVVAHPEVKWPSAVHVREDGALLVGEDPMDMPGPPDQPIDVLWLLRLAPDGSWTRTRFCDRLYAIMGIQEIDDAIYVMNMPHLTVLRDRDGDGVAEERRELLTDLGPPAPGWPGGFNDHIVSGLRLGMDGWLYVSVGDKGIPGGHGTDGSYVQLYGGGVVRVRPDGTQLELVASGTRNHLDVAMDERDTIFTYDNTDDGLGWWTRFTHVMPTGYYGYPWDYHAHPERMLPPMRDDGGGSGVGALIYNEAAWPEEWRGAAYCCDWTDRVVRKYDVAPDGATFRCTGVADFMSAGTSGEFRPLDIAESPDGRYLYVADWNHGGWRTNDVVGRVWRVRRADDEPAPGPLGGLADGTMAARHAAKVDGLLKNLAHPSFRRRVAAQRELSVRAADARYVVELLLEEIYRGDSRRARRHAIWALAGGYELAKGEQRDLIAGHLCNVLLNLVERPEHADHDDARAQVIRALGQLDAPTVDVDDWIRGELRRVAEPVTQREAAIALGRRGSVAATERLVGALATTDDRFLRFAIRQALRALAQRPDFDPAQLLQRLLPQADAATQQEVWQALRELYEPRLAAALAAAAHDPALPAEVRAGALLTLASIEKRAPPWDGKWWETQPAKRPRPARTETWAGASVVSTALERAFSEPQPAPVRAVLATIARESRNPALFPSLRRMAAASADPTEQATLFALLAELKDADAAPLCRESLAHADPQVRAAAAKALGALQGAAAHSDLRPLLEDADAAVRSVARRELARFPRRDDLGAFVAGLADPAAGREERDACRSALIALRHEVRGALEELALRGVLAGDALHEVRSIYTALQPLLQWELAGPFPRDHRFGEPSARPTLPPGARAVTAALPHGFIDLRQALAPESQVSAYGRAIVDVARPRRAKLAVGSDDGVTVWLNGAQVHHNPGDRAWGPDQDSLDVELVAGRNELLIRVEQAGGDWAFNVKLSDEPSGPLFDGATDARPAEIPFDLAAWRAFALAAPGDAARGKALFHAERGPGCFRCHAVAGVGPKVGPDLRDVGRKYDRAELITSILEPSQRIQDGYRASNVFLKNGDVVSGLVTGEANGVVTMVDAGGRQREIPATEIAARKESRLSAMPTGLAEPMTRAELADLVAWLVTLRD